MAIIFSTYFDRLDSDTKKKNKIFVSKSGTKYVPVYEYQFIDGIKTLVRCGESDLESEIQSHAAEADISNIINRFINGDTSVLNNAVGQFGDFSNCPTTYAELFSRVQKCENLFNGLPVEIREKFDNSYQKFWSDFGTENFDNIFHDYNESLVVKTAPVESKKGDSDAE